MRGTSLLCFSREGLVSSARLAPLFWFRIVDVEVRNCGGGSSSSVELSEAVLGTLGGSLRSG